MHRIMYELTHGAIPEGMEVCHTCDNPPCCNPFHLYAGTHQQNMDDAVRRGRFAYDEAHASTKWTPAEIREMRALYEAGWLQKDIAAKFGASTAHVSRVCTGRRRQHVA